MADDLFAWFEQHPCIVPAASAHCPCEVPVPPDGFSDEILAIFTILRSHLGAASAITAPAIAKAAGLWLELSLPNRGTKVRRLLEQYQDYWPMPICGDSDGYYVPETPEELSHYCANLRSRAVCILRRFSSFRKAGRRAGFTYHGRGRWTE